MSVFSRHIIASHLSLFIPNLFSIFLEFFILSVSSRLWLFVVLGARSETSRESTVRSNLVGNAGSRPISEAKQPWACLVLRWGTTGEAHVLYSLPNIIFLVKMMTWVRLCLVVIISIFLSVLPAPSHQPPKLPKLGGPQARVTTKSRLLRWPHLLNFEQT